MRSLFVLLTFGVALTVTSCGGADSGGSPPEYNPDQLARTAISQLDKSGNSSLEESELDPCTSLKSALAAIDKNKDKSISQDELADRFKAYKSTNVAITSFMCVVRYKNQPLDGATVTFVPEEFLKGTIVGGSGKTDSSGVVSITQDGTNAPGLPYGLYRISVSKKNASGTELLPTRYVNGNALGREISPDPRGGTSIELTLTSP